MRRKESNNYITDVADAILLPIKQIDLKFGVTNDGNGDGIVITSKSDLV